MTDDVRKLLGGYATGTLSEQERQILLEAALHDDEVFAALADEEGLKQLLDDGAVRAQLLRATEDPRFSLTRALWEWFDRPKSKALAAIGALLIVAISVQTLRQPPHRPQLAQVRVDETVQRAERAPSQSEHIPPASPQDAAPQAALPPPAPPKPAVRRFEAPSGPINREALESRAQADVREPEGEANKIATANRPVALPPPPPAPAAKPVVTQSPPAVVGSRDLVSGGVVGGVIGGVPPAAPVEAPVAAAELSNRALARTPASHLRYELLRRDQDGEYKPVATDFAFTRGDRIRVRVTAEHNGAVAISADDQAIVSGTVSANIPKAVPATGGITITAATNRLVLSFVPTANAMRGGFRTFSSGPQMKRAGAGGNSNAVEILIRQKAAPSAP